MTVWETKEGQIFLRRVPSQLADIANALEKRNELLAHLNVLLAQLLLKDGKVPESSDLEENVNLPL